MSSRHTAVGVSQILSGLISWGIMGVGWFTLGTTIGGLVTGVACGVLSLGTCPLPFGMVCGLVGFLPVLLGLLEIVSGVLLLVLGDQIRVLGQIAGVFEILSLLYGGVISAVVGVLTLLLLRQGKQV